MISTPLFPKGHKGGTALTEAYLASSRDLPIRPRPVVTLSFAQSLDGSIAARRGHSLNLSGRESMEITHQLRAEHDAILVGIGTLLADNPRLTVRLAKGSHPRPIILDSHLRFPPDSSILKNHPLRPLIVTTQAADPDRRVNLETSGAEILVLPPDPQGRVDIHLMLDHLPGLGLHSLMVEGGAEVITSFLTGRWVDRLTITISPALVGGLRSVEELLHPNSNGSMHANPYSIDQFPQLNNLQIDRAGRDLILSGRVHWGEV